MTKFYSNGKEIRGVVRFDMGDYEISLTTHTKHPEIVIYGPDGHSLKNDYGLTTAFSGDARGIVSAVKYIDALMEMQKLNNIKRSLDNYIKNKS